MMPSLFIAHGAPLLAVEDNDYTRLLADLGRALLPTAVVLFSAHWESPTQLVSRAERYRTIHDFGGFPAELYRIEYPAVGAASLSERIASLLQGAGITVQSDMERGLDHGAWVVLRLLFPAADVPVVAMSVNPQLPPSAQYQIGQALAPLREEDVLIIGSGGTVHNFATMTWRDDAPAAPWAAAFDDWVLSKLSGWDLDALFAYESLAPNARIAVPPHGNEHFIPLFYAMGAADDQRRVRELHRSYRYGSLSHTVWQFGGR